MRWSGDVAIITGRYASIQDSTVIELWSRARSGESVLLRIHGIKPWFEITPHGRWSESHEFDISHIELHDDVVKIVGPEMKWTDLGVKPVWKVYVTQPFMVPKLRQELKGRCTILAGDIPFVNRFFLDGDFSMHVSVDGEIGQSEHPVDICLELTMDDVVHCDPFPAPFKIFSFDLETSIAHDTILCAAVVIEDMGTGKRTHHTFAEDEESILKELTKLPFTSAKDFVEASSSTSSFLLFSSILRRIALKTSKICNDLRLLSSGPRCGFNEIDLPAVAPGSSIMPGKINPVIPEVMNQVCFQVIGADAAISMASEHAQLQLNAFEPLIVYNLLNSLDSMTNGLKVLREKCIDGITANEDVCASHVNNSIGIVTALLPKIGYKKATLVAKTALETNKPVSQVATEVLNFLSQDEADTLLNIENMTGVVAGDKNAEAKRNSYPKRGVDIESPQSAGGDKCNFWSYMYPPERQLFQSAGAM